MRLTVPGATAVLLIGSLLGPPGTSALTPSRIHLGLTRVASGFSQPLLVTNAGDGSGRLFVVEKTGKIRIVKNGKVAAVPFLDLGASVSNGSEHLFADYCSGEIWYVDRRATRGTPPVRALATNALITSFGQDQAGDLYLTDGNGTVYRLTDS